MAIAVMRVWLDDRPGSLAAVAAVLAAAGGDLVGIDVLERGAGRVIDEFVVELPEAVGLDDVVASVHGAPGVDVEFAELAPAFAPDARLDALLLAGALVDAADGAELLDTLVLECRRRFAAAWTVLVDLTGAEPLASSGTPPPTNWLTAFVDGVLWANPREGPVDIAWAPLADHGVVLVIGRERARFRERERRQIEALGAIAARLWDARDRERSAARHPSLPSRGPHAV